MAENDNKKLDKKHNNVKRLSIIIVTYRSENDIYDCVASVWKYSDLRKEELEVIVVDNSPQSESMFSRLRELYGDDVVLIANTHNGGYGQGNNVGIRHATAPVCMIMNPDVRLREPVFSTVVKAFDEDPELCLYGIKQMLSENVVSSKSFVCTRMMNSYVYTFIDAVCNRLNLFLPGLMYFQGSCFFLNKAKFEQVGMFDEQIFMYGEEDDITYRIRKQFGNRLKYNPRLRFIHLTLNRPASLDYEKEKLKSDLYSFTRKGCSRRYVLKNKLRIVNMLLLKERVKENILHKDSKSYDVLRQFSDFLKQELKKEDQGL